MLAQVLTFSVSRLEDGEDDLAKWADAIGGLDWQEVVFLATKWRGPSETKPYLSNKTDPVKLARETLHRDAVGPEEICKDFDELQEVGHVLLRTG